MVKAHPCKVENAGSSPVSGPSIEQIVCQIVELSLDRHTGDSVRDIYSVMMDVGHEVMRLFVQIRKQEIPE
jgi:hypothetical protein